MASLLFNYDRTVIEWIYKKSNIAVPPFLFAIGVLNKEGVLVGAFTLHEYNKFNIELQYWGPNSLTLVVFKQMAHFLFKHLKVTRVTLRTPRTNKVVLGALPKLGFKLEGVMRHFYGPFKKHDAIVFGITEVEARRYLK